MSCMMCIYALADVFISTNTRSSNICTAAKHLDNCPDDQLRWRATSEDKRCLGQHRHLGSGIFVADSHDLTYPKAPNIYIIPPVGSTYVGSSGAPGLFDLTDRSRGIRLYLFCVYNHT